jgi:hypothetical protein
MLSTKKVNKTNEEKIKENHLQRLYQLSLKSTGENPKLDELTDEQEQWVKNHGF